MNKQIVLCMLFSTCMLNAQQYGQSEKHIANSIKENFSKSSSKHFRYGSAGAVTDFGYKQGIKSASDPNASILSFKINPDEKAGAGRGPEIISTKFTHFGSYSIRLKVPNAKTIQPNIGAVVGYFTYHTDTINGLSEIDFEWLLADPRIIYIGTWTGQRGKLERIGRTINMATGEILSTGHKIGYGGKVSPFDGMQNLPATVQPIVDYDASARFYTYGFDWFPDRIRWWMINEANKEKIILWDYSGSNLGIPLHASRYRVNFWHTNNWPVEGNPLSIEKPADKYELEVDWLKYKKWKK